MKDTKDFILTEIKFPIMTSYVSSLNTGLVKIMLTLLDYGFYNLSVNIILTNPVYITYSKCVLNANKNSKNV